MAVKGTGLKTIWITLRAANYTGTVFSNVISQIDFLKNKQKELAIQSMNMAKAALSAGMMFSVLGSEIGGTAGRYTKLISVLMYVVTAISAVRAAVQFLTGVNWAHTISVGTLAISYKMLAVSMASAFAAFIIMYEISKKLPLEINILIGGILALVAAIMLLKAIVSGGTSVAFDIAAITAAGAAAGMLYAAYEQATGSYQFGTRMVRATGPAIVHKGEVIYNPSTGRPTQIANDIEGERKRGTTIMHIPVTIEEVNTKADVEDLDEKLSKVWQRKIRRRR